MDIHTQCSVPQQHSVAIFGSSRIDNLTTVFGGLGACVCGFGSKVARPQALQFTKLVVESGPPSALDNFASMTPSTSMNFEGHGKQLRTSGWFLGSFFVRSLAALIVLALMMLIAAIWVRCGLALVELEPPLGDAMLCGCSWDVSQLVWRWCSCFLVSAAAFANLMTVRVCFPGSSEAFDTENGLVGLFCSSRVCGHFLAHVVRNPGSSGALESSYVPALLHNGSRAERSSCAHLGYGFLHLDY